MTLDTNPPSEKLLSAIQQEYKLLAEYKMIQSECIEGVYVLPSHDNSFLWFGVIFIRDGYFKDATFRFNISLPDQFPEDKTPPTVIFQNEIFHPLISPFTGMLDLSEGFPTWTSNHLWQLLKYIQFVFYQPQLCLSSSDKLPNKEAADLLSQNKAEFIAKAKQSVTSSLERIYETPPTDDKHYIVFEKFDPDLHASVLENLKINNLQKNGNASSHLGLAKENEIK